MQNRSPVPLVVGIAGILVLLLGIWPNWWFSMRPDMSKLEGITGEDMPEVVGHFGLTEMEACEGDRCGSMAYADLKTPAADDPDRPDHDKLQRFLWAGRATLWSGLLLVVLTGGACFLWLTRQRLPYSPAVAGMVLSGVVAIAAVAALLTKPVVKIMGPVELKMGLGFPMTLIGCALCAAAGHLIHRALERSPRMGGSRAD